ncbi:hypothetical protein QP150_18925 [Sphingomonas sp. 22L2VL55-3]
MKLDTLAVSVTLQQIVGMRFFSILLFALAAFVTGCAVLFYFYLSNLACGYSPGASSCHAWPWDLGNDDRFWLLQIPAGIVVTLIAGGLLLRRKAAMRGARQTS